MLQNKEGVVAYFSLEIGLDPKMPTYSGGLGILAGDTIKAAADSGVPLVALTLLYDNGYFHQTIDQGIQHENPVQWNKNEFLKPLDPKVKVQIEGRDIWIQAWKYTVYGNNGKVPVLFLSTNLPENSDWDKEITQNLYGRDRWYRLCQEIILGIGGVKMLRALGYDTEDGQPVAKYHMNEGHSAFLTLALHNEVKQKYLHEDEPFFINDVRSKCVFTTHTPVPAGHDTFPVEFIEKALENYYPIRSLNQFQDDTFNMTHLALHFSEHVNGVAKKHQEVSEKMFPGYQIDSITNGIHSTTWTSEPFKKIYDKYIPGWRKDNFTLRYALNIPKDDIWNAHQERKKELINYVNRTFDVEFTYDDLTIGYARRAATYKRADLILSDIERLKQISSKKPIQIIMAGKAHPNDGAGKDLIKRINEKINQLKGSVKIVYLPNYEMWLGQLMTSGVDVWLNTPKRPLEASGTSGMKAAHNGVPQFSVLDGWWIEGHVEDVTGWSIGPMPEGPEEECDESQDIVDIYDKLENKIIPKYYNHKDKWIQMMQHVISHNASFFNTQRMISQYVTNCYFN